MKFMGRVGTTAGDPTDLLAAEGERIATLVADGGVRQLCVKADYSGVFAILESPDPQQAEREPATLPLVKAGLIPVLRHRLVVDPPGAPAR